MPQTHLFPFTALDSSYRSPLAAIRPNLRPSLAAVPALSAATLPQMSIQSILDGDSGSNAIIRIERLFHEMDRIMTGLMARYGIVALRLSMGVIFFWFGILKFFNGLSPAQALATHTISVMSFGVVAPSVSLPLLATWECLIGLGFLTGKAHRATLVLLFTQMAGTFMPLFLFTHEVFLRIPYAPTLEGQYIIKNLVLVSAAMVIGAAVRGGRLGQE
jgi:uncharacterized membrane protein YphA (DoxX/SURF4 family)